MNEAYIRTNERANIRMNEGRKKRSENSDDVGDDNDDDDDTTAQSRDIYTFFETVQSLMRR